MYRNGGFSELMWSVETIIKRLVKLKVKEDDQRSRWGSITLSKDELAFDCSKGEEEGGDDRRR